MRFLQKALRLHDSTFPLARNWYAQTLGSSTQILVRLIEFMAEVLWRQYEKVHAPNKNYNNSKNRFYLTSNRFKLKEGLERTWENHTDRTDMV